MNQAKVKRRFALALVVLLLALVGGIVLSLSLGTMSVTPAELWRTLTGEGTKQQNLAVFTIRLPRIAIAILVGGALAVSGTILQSVTHNDLAEPSILGISSGAAMFVVVYIYLTNGNNYYSMPTFTVYTMPIIALAGGICAAFIIYALAWKRGMKPTRLLLMGIAVNAAFYALIIVLQLRFDNKDFNRVLAWTSGSIWGSTWSYVIAVGPLILLLCGIAIYKSRWLDVYTLGDETAYGLGVEVERQRRRLIILSVALAAVATSVAGSVAFVGLMAPHISRRIVGPRHKYLTTVAMLMGMLLVVAADIIAKNMFAPIEIHLGIVVSLIGVPYFIYLMLKQ